MKGQNGITMDLENASQTQISKSFQQNFALLSKVYEVISLRDSAQLSSMTKSRQICSAPEVCCFDKVSQATDVILRIW